MKVQYCFLILATHGKVMELLTQSCRVKSLCSPTSADCASCDKKMMIEAFRNSPFKVHPEYTSYIYEPQRQSALRLCHGGSLPYFSCIETCRTIRSCTYQKLEKHTKQTFSTQGSRLHAQPSSREQECESLEQHASWRWKESRQATATYFMSMCTKHNQHV